MFHSSDVVQLREGERIEGIIRRHGATLWPKLFLSGLLIVVPFFFLFALLSLGTFGVILLVLTVATGMFFALKFFIQWDANVLVLTNERLIHVDQRGLWSRRVFETPLPYIQSVECKRNGFKDWICRTATVTIASTGSGPDIHFSALPRYKQFKERLDSMRGGEVRRISLNDIR